jgi:putative ABC transport system permease protein
VYVGEPRTAPWRSVDFASGGRQQALDQIQRMGVNVLAVTPQQDRSVGGRARTGAIVQTLVDADYTHPPPDSIDRKILRSGHCGIPPERRRPLNDGAGRRLRTQLRFDKELAPCRSAFFEEAGERCAARVAVLGYIVARDLFDDASPVGQHLSVNRTPFEIVGVLTERGQGLDVAAEDDQIYIPLRTAMHRLMNVEYYTGLLLEIDRPDRMDASVIAILRQRHPNPRSEIRVNACERSRDLASSSRRPIS